MFTSESQPAGKAPHAVLDTVLDDVFAFAPNRDTLGGTAYFIVNNSGNIMIDAPAWSPANQEFIAARGGVAWLLITHRDGLGQTAKIVKELACPVVIQEQEAYLLPDTNTITYHQGWRLGEEIEAIWTPGYSPGSACIYYAAHGGMLFTGRHLLPDRSGQPKPLQMPKTFHWPRQVKNANLVAEKFPPERLRYLFPGASTGLLRGRGYMEPQTDYCC
jgi:glyoxylase-like metal-dependent hydrolase (beta-lactamase superfamily II)